MNMDEQQLTYEQFKEDILRWKNTHREEYVRFARLMTNGDEKQYLAICRAIFRQLPKSKLNGNCAGTMTVRRILQI